MYNEVSPQITKLGANFPLEIVKLKKLMIFYVFMHMNRASLMSQKVKEFAWQFRRHKRHAFDPCVRKILLGKEMSTHSGTLAWKIPWKEKPCRLLSIGSQRVGHDWATSPSLFTICIYMHVYFKSSHCTP